MISFMGYRIKIYPVRARQRVVGFLCGCAINLFYVLL
jgi:hypothetical protein